MDSKPLWSDEKIEAELRRQVQEQGEWEPVTFMYTDCGAIHTLQVDNTDGEGQVLSVAMLKDTTKIMTIDMPDGYAVCRRKPRQEDGNNGPPVVEMTQPRREAIEYMNRLITVGPNHTTQHLFAPTEYVKHRDILRAMLNELEATGGTAT